MRWVESPIADEPIVFRRLSEEVSAVVAGVGRVALDQLPRPPVDTVERGKSRRQPSDCDAAAGLQHAQER